MDFKFIILHKRYQTKKVTPYHFIYINEKAKLYKQNEIRVCHELEVRERLTTNRHKKNLGKVMELLSILIFVFAIKLYNLLIFILKKEFYCITF